MVPRCRRLIPDRPGGRPVPWVPNRGPGKGVRTALRRQAAHLGSPELLEPLLGRHRSHCLRPGHPGVERAAEQGPAPAEARNCWTLVQGRRLHLEPSPLPAGESNQRPTRRSRHQRLDHDGLGRVADLPAERATRRRLHQPGRARSHRPRLRKAAELPAGGTIHRPRPFQVARSEPLGPVVNGTGPRDEMVTPHLGTRRRERLGRRGSYPCATGRRLMGRIPR